MRAIGLFVILIVLMPARLVNEKTGPGDNAAKQFSLHFPFYPGIVPASNKQKEIDTTALKQSGWYANALNTIETSEYKINYDSTTGNYTSPNRQQNIRSFYSPRTFTLLPRTGANDNWQLELTTVGVYAGKKLAYAPAVNPIITRDENNIRFNHNNDFVTEYINSKEGIRQNFIIEKEPSSESQILNVKLQISKGWFVNKVHDKEIHFAKETSTGYDKKITYNDLKAWDATGKELKSVFTAEENCINIIVNTEHAVYPVTIDPISTTANTMLESNNTNAYFGRRVSSAGDVNGDGYSDVCIGAWQYSNGQTNEGAVFIYHGSATGVSTTPAIILEGNQDGAWLGYGVGTAGDLNADGFSDIVTGAPGYDNGQVNEGAVFIHYGSASGISSTPSVSFESNQDGAEWGYYTETGGDINGDGFSDLLVGAYLYDNGQTDEGIVVVYHGSAGGIITTPAALLECNQAGALFGREVCSAGDVNGDGFSDILIGAAQYDNGETNEGVVFVYHGSAAGIVTTPALMLESNQAESGFGYSIASAGDLNGDGFSDIVIGATFYDNGITDEGAAFIYHGSASGINSTVIRMLEGNQFESRFGYKTSSAGDMNGDGYSDLIIGAYFFDNGQADEGTAYLYYGSATGIGAVPNYTFECNQAGAVFGIGATSAGDVNGDGYSDLLIGAFTYDSGQADEGAAFIYHGSPDGLSVAPLIINNITQNQAGFGNSVNSAGDVNGDGFSDVIIGASFYDVGSPDEGRVFVYYGSLSGISIAPSVILNEANQANAWFGFSCAGVGDVNGDGYGDIAIGAFQYNGIGRTYIYFGSSSGLSTISNQILDGTQSGENFGVYVSGAGDVNGDGYSDIVVGSYGYDVGPNADEGRACIYQGGASGLNTTPARILNSANQAGAFFGRWVASAGDVNGDGYGDVLIGALSYDNGASADEGAVFVYYGSIAGIPASPNLMLTGANQAGARFGTCSSGGDINGDGFSDVIVGSFFYNSQRGRAYVFYGSSTGLSTIPFILENNIAGSNNGDQMGFAVNSAGDINGDGYSDLIVGIAEYANPFIDAPQGRAFVYLGRATGVSASPDIILTDNVNNHQFFGYVATSAGDVNGDGFSDIIVGGPRGSWTGFGICWLYLGNDKGGLRNNLRLYNSDLVTPMNRANITDPNLFGAGLYAKSFIGRQKGKLVWQTVRNGNAFTGVPITNSTLSTAQQVTFTNLGLAGVELKSQIAKMVPTKQTYVRARVKYDLATAITGQVYGPWRYPEGFLRGKREIADVALPVKFLSFTATKEKQSVFLKWITANEEPGIQYELLHSTDGIHFSGIHSATAQLLLRNEYDYRHMQPAKGNNYYRIRAYLNSREAFSEIRVINFSGENKIQLYPNPVKQGESFSIILPAGSPDNVQVRIINASGQQVFVKNYNGAVKIEVPVNDWKAGFYVAEIRNENQLINSIKIVVQGNR